MSADTPSKPAPSYPRDPDNDLTTRDLAERYGVSLVADGGWFRKGIIPPEHAYRVPVLRANGIVGLEWRVPAAALADFQPPDPKGGRPRREDTP